MNAQTQAELLQHLEAIGQILYAEADRAELKTLEGIETTVRSLAQEYVLPEIGFFLSKQRRAQLPEKNETSVAPLATSPSPLSKPNGCH